MLLDIGIGIYWYFFTYYFNVIYLMSDLAHFRVQICPQNVVRYTDYTHTYQTTHYLFMYILEQCSLRSLSYMT